jgi:two-component sensor histidine kinase
MHANLSAAERIEKLLHREQALARFGTFAFRQTDLQVVLDEAARVCAECLDLPFCKVCMYRPSENDLLVVAGHGWKQSVVGYAISVADRTSPQGLAFETGEPQLCPSILEANTYILPPFYKAHGVISTADVLIAAEKGPPFGVLEVDSQESNSFDKYDIDFLTGFANVLAEAVATAGRVKAMETLIDEKETLGQELKHRVRNNLHLVYGLLLAELDAGHDEASIQAFRSIAARVMGLAEVFDHLLGTGMHRVINFGDYVSALCRRLPELFGENEVNLVCTVEPAQLDLDVVTALGIVITEMVSNAYLHAFPGGRRDGEISVVLGLKGNQMDLSIRDNGIGFVEGEGQRRGIRLIRRLVEQTDSRLILRVDHGTLWTIERNLEKDSVVPA